MRAKDRLLANDLISDADFEALLLAWFGNASRCRAPVVASPSDGFMNLPNYPPALKSAGLCFSQAVIRVKEHPVLTRMDFMGAHEWCMCGRKPGAAHRFFGPPNVTHPWRVKTVSPNARPRAVREALRGGW